MLKRAFLALALVASPAFADPPAEPNPLTGGNGQGAKHLPPPAAAEAAPAPSQNPAQFPKLKAFRRTAAAEAERRYLRDLISSTGGNLKQICKVSGLSRSRLYELLKKHNLPSRLHGV